MDRQDQAALSGNESAGARVLVVDDEAKLVLALRLMLERAGYAVTGASDGAEALACFKSQRPDLVLLDIMMPGMDGYQVCREIQRVSPEVPVLFLSAKGDIADMSAGFHLGADDYIVKPFRQGELLLRVEAALRRQYRLKACEQDCIIGDLRVSLARKEVHSGTDRVALTPKEYAVLALLARYPNQVFTRDEIVEKVWGAEYVGTQVGVPVYIRHIREKIEPNPEMPVYLVTVGRMGYMLQQR